MDHSLPYGHEKHGSLKLNTRRAGFTSCCSNDAKSSPCRHTSSLRNTKEPATQFFKFTTAMASLSKTSTIVGHCERETNQPTQPSFFPLAFFVVVVVSFIVSLVFARHTFVCFFLSQQYVKISSPLISRNSLSLSPLKIQMCICLTLWISYVAKI